MAGAFSRMVSLRPGKLGEPGGVVTAFGGELFAPPYRERIIRLLPGLFDMVELENRRGKKLGMEVGSARERVLTALFMYVYGYDKIEFPSTVSPELDVLVDGNPVSIKTKKGGLSGVKLTWTVDWDSVDAFLDDYSPGSDMVFVRILWGKTGALSLIPQSAQIEVLDSLGIDEYTKVPPRGTNPRGVELSLEAMRQLLNHHSTQSMNIEWSRDTSPLSECELYMRWIELWGSL